MTWYTAFVCRNRSTSLSNEYLVALVCDALCARIHVKKKSARKEPLRLFMNEREKISHIPPQCGAIVRR